MAKTALLSIDQGTTSSRAIVFDVKGDIVAVAQRELTLYTPHAGWVEQNPADIWADTLWACRTALAEASDKGYEVASIGITNQRETTILWDRKTGEPVYNAIVWQDRRTADLCAALKEAGHEPVIAERTGLLLDPYFSATKIAWILDNVDGTRARAEAGELAFGTVECFVLWHLTGGVDGGVHMSDATNAARTMLFNVRDQRWDQDLLDLFGVPAAILPVVGDNVAKFGVSAASVLEQAYPIGAMMGDQQAALAGQGCFDVGSVKSTYGTGCFALLNIGADFKASDHRLLTTVAARFDGQVSYALEGSIFVAGAAVQWLRDGLGIIGSAAESEALAVSVSDNGGVYFVPALTGLGAPYWEPEATGLLTGLRRDSGRAHIARAALEAQAYQTYDLFKAMEADGGVWPEVIRVDGGLVHNGFMCQFLADILQVRVDVPVVSECTAWGVAALAGVSAGVFDDVYAIAAGWRLGRSYEPDMAEDRRQDLLMGWADAVSKVRC